MHRSSKGERESWNRDGKKERENINMYTRLYKRLFYGTEEQETARWPKVYIYTDTVYTCMCMLREYAWHIRRGGPPRSTQWQGRRLYIFLRAAWPAAEREPVSLSQRASWRLLSPTSFLHFYISPYPYFGHLLPCFSLSLSGFLKL